MRWVKKYNNDGEIKLDHFYLDVEQYIYHLTYFLMLKYNQIRYIKYS